MQKISKLLTIALIITGLLAGCVPATKTVKEPTITEEKTPLEVSLPEDLQGDLSIDTIEIDKLHGTAKPTNEQLSKIEKQLASLDFTVRVSPVETLNTENIEDYYKALQENKRGCVLIFTVYNYGIQGTVLTNKDGYAFIKNINMDFPTADTPITKPAFSQEISGSKDVQISENGFFIITPQDDLSPQGFIAKITPYKPELQQLTDEYVSGLSYVFNNLISLSWTEETIGNVLDFDYALEELYYKNYDNSLFTDYGDSYSSTTDSIDVPASIVEDLMLSNLPVRLDQVRQHIHYDSMLNMYFVKVYEGGGYAPTPYVLDYTENDDGTLTLIVHGLGYDFYSENTVINKIIIEPSPEGGYMYLSNSVTFNY